MSYRKHLLWVVIGMAAVVAALSPNAVIAGFHWLSNLFSPIPSTQLFGMAVLLLIVVVALVSLRDSRR